MAKFFRAGKAGRDANQRMYLHHGSQKQNQRLSSYKHAREHVSEVDLMTGKYPSSFYRRVERSWAGRIKSLRQIRGQIVVATERTLQRMFNRDGSLIPIPVRAVSDRQRRDRGRSRD